MSGTKKRYRIIETLVLGEVEVPEGEDVFAWMDKNDAWPDDEEVLDHNAIEIDEEGNPVHPS